MTDKELDELAEQEAYKAIGVTKKRLTEAPFWTKCVTIVGLFSVVAGCVRDRPIGVLYGIGVIILGAVLNPFAIGVYETKFAVEKAKILERLKKQHGEHSDKWSQDNCRHDGTRR